MWVEFTQAGDSRGIVVRNPVSQEKGAMWINVLKKCAMLIDSDVKEVQLANQVEHRHKFQSQARRH